MKKYLVLVAIIGFSVVSLCGCGSCSTSNSASSEEDIKEITVTGSDGKEYKSYQAACRACDFEAAHEYVDQLYSRFVKELDDTNPSGANAFNQNVKGEKEFMSAEDYVFKQEMMYLVSNGDEQSSDKIIYLLTELQVLGEPLNEGLNDFYDALSLPQRLYSQYIKRFNSHCDQILDLAISQNNDYLAKKVLGMYKKNIDIFNGGSDVRTPDGTWAKKAPDGTYVDGNHCYVKYLDSDKEAAEKKYEKKWK